MDGYDFSNHRRAGRARRLHTVQNARVVREITRASILIEHRGSERHVRAEADCRVSAVAVR